MQPNQQQGRRFPSLSSETTLSTCSFLFSGILTDIVQQIHSLRESGVTSSQTTKALGSEDKAFRKSSGIVCAVPLEISLLTIKLFYHFSSPIPHATIIPCSGEDPQFHIFAILFLASKTAWFRLLAFSPVWRPPKCPRK